MGWQIYGVWASFAVSVAGLGLIVWKVEPQAASLNIKILFFVAFFMLVWSMATLVTFYIKNRLVKSRALSGAAYEPIFYDSFLTGLLISIALLIFISARRWL